MINSKISLFIFFLSKDQSLWLSQCNYVEKMLERFSMDNAKLISTPLMNHFKFSIAQCLKRDDKVKYVRSLLYQCNGVFNVCYGLYKIGFGTCSQCGELKSRIITLGYSQVDLHIFQGYYKYGIMFNKQQGNPSVVGYIDVDHARGEKILFSQYIISQSFRGPQP